MNRHVVSVVWAALITVASLIGNIAAITSYGGQWWRFVAWAALPSFPAGLIVGFLGLGRGPDGLPTQQDISLYLFTFLFWWAIVELLRSVMRQTADH